MRLCRFLLIQLGLFISALLTLARPDALVSDYGEEFSTMMEEYDEYLQDHARDEEAPDSELGYQFKNGYYKGESICNAAADHCQIPHGMGTFKDSSGKTLYHGEWVNGKYPERKRPFIEGFKYPCSLPGLMEGIGTQYFDDDSTYKGYFRNNDRNGIGVQTWPNGTTYKGVFVNNVIDKAGRLLYANGDERIGQHSELHWKNGTTFKEATEPKEKFSLWTEEYLNFTYYRPQVQIYKNVVTGYADVTLQVICKIHAANPKGQLLREGQVLLDNVEYIENGEILRIVATLPFRDEVFNTYTCQANDTDIPVEDSLRIRNPFFLEAQALCGEQLVLQDEDTGQVDESAVAKVLTKSGKLGRVVKGHEAYRGQVPWQVVIFLRHEADTKRPHCGGTIISPWHVLTAAHCIQPNDTRLTTKDLTVKIGATTIPTSLNGYFVDIKRIYMHEGFYRDSRTGFLYNDIALLVIEEKITIGKYINPVCMLDQEYTPQIGESLTVSGFGKTFDRENKTRGWMYPGHLQVAQIRFLHKELCFHSEQEDDFSFDGHMCAGSGISPKEDKFSSDSCGGDSGGPVTVMDSYSKRHYLVGLVSFGSQLCGYNAGAAYVNVTHYISWVNSRKLLDLVQEYNEREYQIPYDKIDSPSLKAVFEHLKQTVEP